MWSAPPRSALLPAPRQELAVSGDRQYRKHEESRERRAANASRKAAKAGRDPGSFVPWLRVVQQSPGWRHASHTARSLLMDMLQSGPNGRLTASMKYLTTFGWTSNSTVTKAIAELIGCGLLIETRKGRRPNVAAWYACTWMKLQHTDGLDISPGAFKTGGYLTPEVGEPRRQKSRTAAATEAKRKAAIARAHCYTLTPSNGVESPSIAPSNGVESHPPTPSNGAMRALSTPPSTPLDGAYLDIAISPRSAQSAAGVTHV